MTPPAGLGGKGCCERLLPKPPSLLGASTGRWWCWWWVSAAAVAEELEEEDPAVHDADGGATRAKGLLEVLTPPPPLPLVLSATLLVLFLLSLLVLLLVLSPVGTTRLLALAPFSEAGVGAPGGVV